MILFPLHRFAYQFVHRVIQKISNESGCFGGGKVPSIPAAPAIAPAPVPTQTAPDSTLQGRQRQIAMLKYGALSTITNQGAATGITGQTGTGPNLFEGGSLFTGQGMYPSMSNKTTVGQ